MITGNYNVTIAVSHHEPLLGSTGKMGRSQASDLGAAGASAPQRQVMEGLVAGGCGLGWWNEGTRGSFRNYLLKLLVCIFTASLWTDSALGACSILDVLWLGLDMLERWLRGE